MIEKVELVFENCEYAVFQSKDIYHLYLGDLRKCAYAYNLNHYDSSCKDDSRFEEHVTSSDFEIGIYKQALKDRKTFMGDDLVSDVTERLMFGDITHVYVYTKDVDYKYIWLPLRQKNGLRKYIRIPLRSRKKRYIYSLAYKEKNSEELGSPNVYQSWKAEVTNNYYNDEIFWVSVKADDKE